LDAADRTEIAAFVQRHTAAGTSTRMRADGYASVDGPEDLNWRLSCERAIAIRDELVTLGISSQDIVTIAHGETTEFSATEHAPNRRATITALGPARPLPTLRGPALAQTPAAPANPLPADTIRVWRALVAKGDLEGALHAVVWAMERRGEIDMRLLRTRPSARIPVCQESAAIALDPTLSGAFTTPCGCLGPRGNATPNPRIRIQSALVSHNLLAPGHPRQTSAEVLHSTLRHEFRHVVQEYETCNGSLTTPAQGVCTDCNSPLEMDAYLSEIEAGPDSSAFRNAWVRVFVNRDFLSPLQRAAFQGRMDAAEQKVSRSFPGVDWDADPEVVRARARCNGLGPTPPHVGGCNEIVSSGP
jgi:hypothetical protein